LGDARPHARTLLTAGGACLYAVGLAVVLQGAWLAQEPQAAGALGQPLEPPPRSALPIRLVGLMADSADPSRSACLVRCPSAGQRRSASTVEVGATACDLATVEEVRPDAVVIRNLLTNRLELLMIQTADAPAQVQAPAETPAAPAPAIVKTTPDLVNVDVPKASVDHYLLNLPELLSSAVATPRYREAGPGTGAIEGFEISQIKEGSVVEKLGLRNGDVILEVNGEELDGLPTVLRLFGQVQASPQAKLTVLRSGQRMTFVFNTK
jgi:type II secretory pathway component PulC